MKYKHYSPKAKVVLFEAIPRKDTRMTGESSDRIPLVSWRLVQARNKQLSYLGLEDSEWPIKIGMVTTRYWDSFAQFQYAKWSHLRHPSGGNSSQTPLIVFRGQELETPNSFAMRAGELWQAKGISLGGGMREPPAGAEHIADVIEISLGSEVTDIAHGLFSALRELDQRGMDIIYVEGIEDEGDIAAAVMNRLRKAASVIEK
jgi:L-threonylcarbamoyladenylate synthase